MRVTIHTIAVLAAIFALAGCGDPLAMLAGGAKGYCNHNPGGACSRPSPVEPPRAPPRR